MEMNSSASTASSAQASGMHFLTGETWRGLPLARYDHDSRDEHLDFELPLSMLALHEQGSGEIGVGRDALAWRFSVVPGHFDFYPAGHYDVVMCSPGRKVTLLLTVPNVFERQVLESRRGRYPLGPYFQFQDRRLRHMVQALADSASSRSHGNEVEVSLSIVDRLHEVLSHPNRRDAPVGFSPLMLQMIAEHIDRNLDRSVDLNTESFARLTGLGATQFSEAFRCSFGKSLRQHVLERRIEMAKQHLLGGQCLVTEVAHALGFASHAHFATVFKRRVGVTPSQFRERRVSQTAAPATPSRTAAPG